MKYWKVSLTALGAISLATGSIVLAQGQQAYEAAAEAEAADDDPFKQYLYDPELILRYADEINLTEAQRRFLITEITEVEASVRRIELENAFEGNRLLEALTADNVDREGLLAVVDDLLERENQTKRLYVALLVDLHNDLTPGQRAQLDAIKARSEGQGE